MHIQIEATGFITEIDGVPVRLWEGTTGTGIPCKVFIHRIAVSNQVDQTAFDAELLAQMPPASPSVPLAFILN
jgi:hypothetical protein